MTDPKNGKDEPTPKKGGFGAFAQKYRDRWAGNHPGKNFTNAEHGTPSRSRPNEHGTKPAVDMPAADEPKAKP